MKGKNSRVYIAETKLKEERALVKIVDNTSKYKTHSNFFVMSQMNDYFVLNFGFYNVAFRNENIEKNKKENVVSQLIPSDCEILIPQSHMKNFLYVILNTMVNGKLINSDIKVSEIINEFKQHQNK